MRRLLLIFLLLALLGALVAGFGLYFAGARPGALLGGGQVLTLVVDGELEELGVEAPLPWLDRGSRPALAELWLGFAAARRDPSVRGLAVRIVDADFGLAKAQELRRQLAALAAAGLPVDCFLDTAGEGSNGTLEVYLASACSRIALSPAGELNFLGLWADSLFLRGSLDKLRIEPSFLAAGRYKSAAEAWTEVEHSPAAREAVETLLDGFYAQIIGGVAAARGLAPDAVRALVDESPLSPERARAAGLVDLVEYPDELRERLESETGTTRWVDLAEYGRAAERRARARSRRGEIAVVFAQGTILRGAGGIDPWTGARFLGPEGVGATLAELAEDDRVRAVVLRVDSPGGSAVASDLLSRRVERLRARKPVVVSMSDVAASGATISRPRPRASSPSRGP
jgi:protease IV